MSAPVLPVVYDTGPWHGRLLALLDHGVTAALLVSVAVMVGVVSAQVALRYLFNESIDWADEVSRLAFVCSIFLAIIKVCQTIVYSESYILLLLIHLLPIRAHRISNSFINCKSNVFVFIKIIVQGSFRFTSLN